MSKALYWAYVGFTDLADGKTRPILYIRPLYTTKIDNSLK